MKLYDYNNKTTREVNDNKALSFLYNNVLGRFLLKIMTSKFISNLVALYMNSRLSKLRIKKFIEKNNIDMSDYSGSYKSFNDFFIRKTDKRVISDHLVAPCDGKLSVYKIDSDLKLNIKNSIYTLSELVLSDCSEYKDGYALVYRLTPDDYHHYIFPFTGTILSTKHIKGKLHTVQPLALKKYKVFSENTREVTYIDCEYGKVVYIEVGAMMIGKIVNNDIISFNKGDYKGHFEFGGSTIILLFDKNIKIDDIIINNSIKDIETIVKMGNRIGM